MLTTGQSAVLFIVLLAINIGGCRDISRFRSGSSDTLGQGRSKRSLDQFRLCGNQLVNMLSIICRVYSLSHRGNEKYHGDLSFSTVESKNTVRHKRSLSTSSRRHRVRGSQGVPRGLASSCCQTSCSVDQLMGAC